MNKEALENKLKGLLASEGYSLTAIVKLLKEAGKITSLQNISNKLKRGTLNALELEEILNAIGYTLDFKKL